jgi:hypothetical protein
LVAIELKHRLELGSPLWTMVQQRVSTAMGRNKLLQPFTHHLIEKPEIRDQVALSGTIGSDEHVEGSQINRGVTNRSETSQLQFRQPCHCLPQQREQFANGAPVCVRQQVPPSATQKLGSFPLCLKLNNQNRTEQNRTETKQSE